MSHGPTSGDEVEVNMIPMIDIVIQLIAFFLILFNFDKSNIDERIRLPIADLASPSIGATEEPLVLNLDADGGVSWLGERHDVGSTELAEQLRLEHQVALRFVKKRSPDGPKPRVETTIVIRADREVDYGKVQRLMKLCQDIGFYKYSLRASPAQESM